MRIFSLQVPLQYILRRQLAGLPGRTKGIGAPIVLGIKHLPLSELSQLAVSICICASLYIGTLYFLKDKTLYEILLRFHIIKNLP